MKVHRRHYGPRLDDLRVSDKTYEVRLYTQGHKISIEVIVQGVPLVDGIISLPTLATALLTIKDSQLEY